MLTSGSGRLILTSGADGKSQVKLTTRVGIDAGHQGRATINMEHSADDVSVK
jgi:hypothetical protein